MVEVKEIKDMGVWDAFVESSEQGTIFCTSKWLQLFDLDYHIYSVVRNGNIIGGAGNFTNPAPITQSQGVLVAPQVSKYVNQLSVNNEVATALIPYLPDEFACHYTFPDVRPFLWGGYQASVRYTYVVKPDWNELEKGTRNEINKTDVKVELSDDIELFDSLYDYTFTHKNLKRTASTKLILRLFNTPFAELYMASDQSAGVMLIHDSKRYYYILGASLSTGTSSKVLWEAIKDKKEVDMVGCNNQLIDRFKKGFGGRLYAYYNCKR
jgi:hypothetical protein